MKRLLALVVFLAACTSSDTPGNTIRDSTAAPPATTAPSKGTWQVGPDGAGPLRVGMSYAELAPLMVNPNDTARALDECGYIEIEDAPESMRFMVEGKRLVRIEVSGGTTATAEGARVGDSEARILSLYPSARRQPRKYVDGHTFVVLPNAPADTLHRYVFETDGSIVKNFRAGVFPPVEYVEGCS